MKLRPNRTSFAPCSLPSRTPAAPRAAVASRSLTATAPVADSMKRSGRRNSSWSNKETDLYDLAAAKSCHSQKPELARQRADGAIGRSHAQDNPSHPMAPTRRQTVGNLCRGPHLGSGQMTASTDRTYDRKRSDSDIALLLASKGPSTYGWPAVAGHDNLICFAPRLSVPICD